MPAKKDITGMGFGRLTALNNDSKKVLCKCSCGNTKSINRNHLMAGNTLSCGCLQKESVMKRNESHGMSSARLYSIWTNMKSRCYNENVECYNHYGGKGVVVCDEWLTFEGFIETIPEGYSDNLELDRIDPNGNYEYSNCRWVNRSLQCFNKRDLLDKGVSYHQRDDLWKANISKDGRRFVKYFKQKIDAINWRLNKIKELYGEEYLNRGDYT